MGKRFLAYCACWLYRSYQRNHGDWGGILGDVMPVLIALVVLIVPIAILSDLLAHFKRRGRREKGAEDGQLTLHPSGQFPAAKSLSGAQGEPVETQDEGRVREWFARFCGNIRETLFLKLPRNLWLFTKDAAFSWWGEFRRYASFRGRTTRWKFLVFILINAGILWFLPDTPRLVAGAVLALPVIASCIRRVNDTCTSPWMVLVVPLLPLLLLAPTVESGDTLPGKGVLDRVVWNIWSLMKEAFGKWWGCLAKSVSFRGKMSRGDFLAYYAMFNIVSLVLDCLATCWEPFLFGHLLFVLPTLATSCRRLNDTGISPWFCLLFLVPPISPWVLPVNYLWLILQLVPSAAAKECASAGKPSGMSPAFQNGGGPTA